MTQQEKKDAFIQFFYENDFPLTVAIKECGLYGLTMHYRYMVKDEDYKASIEMGNNKVEMWLDRAEAALMKNVNSGNQKAIEFLLTSKGKARNWGKSSEHTVKVEHRAIAEITMDMSEDKFIEMGEEANNKIPKNAEDLDALAVDYFGHSMVIEAEVLDE